LFIFSTIMFLDIGGSLRKLFSCIGVYFKVLRHNSQRSFYQFDEVFFVKLSATVSDFHPLQPRFPGMVRPGNP
jgi:hypothetical protein